MCLEHILRKDRAIGDGFGGLSWCLADVQMTPTHQSKERVLLLHMGLCRQLLRLCLQNPNVYISSGAVLTFTIS